MRNPDGQEKEKFKRFLCRTSNHTAFSDYTYPERGLDIIKVKGFQRKRKTEQTDLIKEEKSSMYRT